MQNILNIGIPNIETLTFWILMKNIYAIEEKSNVNPLIVANLVRLFCKKSPDSQAIFEKLVFSLFKLLV